MTRIGLTGLSPRVSLAQRGCRAFMGKAVGGAKADSVFCGWKVGHLALLPNVKHFRLHCKSIRYPKT